LQKNFTCSFDILIFIFFNNFLLLRIKKNLFLLLKLNYIFLLKLGFSHVTVSLSYIFFHKDKLRIPTIFLLII
jgi:hypothetical protein